MNRNELIENEVFQITVKAIVDDLMFRKLNVAIVGKSARGKTTLLNYVTNSIQSSVVKYDADNGVVEMGMIIDSIREERDSVISVDCISNIAYDRIFNKNSTCTDNMISHIVNSPMNGNRLLITAHTYGKILSDDETTYPASNILDSKFVVYNLDKIFSN